MPRWVGDCFSPRARQSHVARHDRAPGRRRALRCAGTNSRRPTWRQFRTPITPSDRDHRMHGQRQPRTLKPMTTTPERPHRRLTLSATDKKIAGVCGGLAEYFNTDATLVRLIFVVLIMLGGSGVIIYLIAWIIMPTA